MPPLRIALCITELDAGGAERALVQLATRLDRALFEPAVFCLGPPAALVAPLEAAGIPVECLGARRRSDLFVIARLWRALRRFRPDLVQSYLFHANIAARFAGRLAGARRIVSGIRVAERRSQWPLRIDRLTNGLVDTNVCVSRGVAEFTTSVAGLPERKTVVIPNGVDADAFARATPADLTEFGIPSTARVVLTVGRLDPQKGLLTLVAAARRLVAKFTDLHFLIVGEGPQRPELEQAITEARLNEHVHLAGWRQDVPRLLQGADCLALPSLWEGMPNVILESMAAGLPVVASRVEGTAELVSPGETGLLIAPDSVDELEAALREVLSDPARSAAWGEAGYQAILRDYSWEKCVSAYQSLYLRLLDQHPTDD